MKLYNTLTRRIEEFIPRTGKVSLYVCGITPYDTTHVGHAFTYSVFDILTRYLELRNLEVRYVQNVTDIDDDILKRAYASGKEWNELGNEWTTHFVRDMQKLNILPPYRFPRATEVISDIVKAVKKLVKAGVAYESGGSVYFSVDSWRKFGTLSQLPKVEMLPIANERGNHPEDPNKQDPLDFVLWQAQAPGEPAWKSPWGLGRPGWHIECSTISTKYLGDVIDIHGGGADLCFPHHECEIAQVESVRKEEPFVRYWMHVAMVGYEGEKMSKSLGNLVMIQDLLARFTPDAIRWYLASHHYREPWAFKEKELEKAQVQADILKKAYESRSGSGTKLEPDPTWASFARSMDDDLGTQDAVKAAFDLAEQIIEASLAERDVEEAQQSLLKLCNVLGLRLNKSEPDERVEQGWNKLLQHFLTA